MGERSMKINPAMLYLLTLNQSPEYNDKLSCTMIISGYDIDFNLFAETIDSTNNGAIREVDIRDYLTATYGSDYSLKEFRVRTVPVVTRIGEDSLTREFQLLYGKEGETFIKEGTAKSFIYIHKEEDSNSYNSRNAATEVIFGTIGQIGDEVESDLMLKSTAITESTSLAKNTIVSVVKC